MKKIFFFILISLISADVFSQTLVGSYPFPLVNRYNSFYGMTLKNDTLFVGSGTASSIYKISKTGQILDSFAVPYTFNQGLAWDGTGFWIASAFRSGGARIYKVDRFGARMDSIYLDPRAEGIAGLVRDGNGMWFCTYYPDFPTYPFAKAYKVDFTTKQIVDSIPLYGKQCQGITIKGDTIIYVSDNFQSDQERIYGYRKAVGDTVFSFAAPDPDNDCDPRGMAWDGQNLYLIANRIGNNIGQFRTLYKYTLSGAGNPTITTLPATSLNIGNVIINQTGSQNLQINNVGTAPLIISSRTFNNPRFSITPNNVPDTINAGQFKIYNVNFSPLAFGNDSAVLSIASNDGGTPIKTVRIYGKGIQNGSFISMSATNYNYGNRRIKSLSGYTFTITNQGSAPLQISGASFNTPYFKVDTVGNPFPIQIDTQRTYQMRVWFNPSEFGLINTIVRDTLKINSNAVNQSSGVLTISGTPRDTNSNVGLIWWEGVVPDNPFTSADDLSIKSLKQINDVNGDGVNDIIATTDNYYTLCYNGNASVTADVLWAFNTGTNNNNSGSVPYDDAMQVRTDVDGDGIQDVVIGCAGGNEFVYTLSGRTGKVIWAYGDSINFSNGDINGIDVRKDYNGDGVNDVLASASGQDGATPGRRTVFCLNGINGNVIFQYPLSTPFLYSVISMPNGGAIANNNNGGPYYVNGFNNSGVGTWTFNSTGNIYNMKQINDINGDGQADILAYADSGILFGSMTAINGANGNLIWRKGFGQKVFGQISIFPDNISSIFSGPRILYKIDNRDGAEIWNATLDNTYILGAAIVGRVNSIFPDAVAATTLGNKVYILSSTGQILFTYEFGSGGNSTAAERVTGLKNINPMQLGMNNSDEIVAGSRDGRIICFSGGWYLEGNVNPVSNVIPEKFVLSQNYPNPFNPETKISFGIPKNSLVRLKVYDMLGREVASLVNENLSAGMYEYTFTGSNLSSGVYFYKLDAGNFTETKRMLLVK
ncbi:MAG: choice-of-anchor D domain-containing protein [Ignavibacteria bacterium]|nr:choice-of-anchor D domain-containing protein [Ignavibacteria bacterium]